MNKKLNSYTENIVKDAHINWWRTHERPHRKLCKQELTADFTQERSNYTLLKHQVWLIYDTTVRNNIGLSSGMDINCWQFLNLAWSIDVTGDHTWQLQMTARRPSSMVMFLGTSGHDMVNICLVDYVYRYKNIATDMSWYECLELTGLDTGTVTVHSEIHYTPPPLQTCVPLDTIGRVTDIVIWG